MNRLASSPKVSVQHHLQSGRKVGQPLQRDNVGQRLLRRCPVSSSSSSLLQPHHFLTLGVRSWRLKTLALLALLILAGGMLGAAVAQLEVAKTQVTVEFGRQVTIVARFRAPRPIERVYLFLHPEGTMNTYSGEMEAQGKGWKRTFTLKEWPLPPFATVYYWFQVRYQDGSTEQTAAFTFEYADTRFTWETLAEPPIFVHWTQGDPTVAQELINAAQEAIQRTRMQWLAPSPQRVDVYLYPDATALEPLLQDAPEWAGASAYPALGTILLIHPTTPAELAQRERDVAHEVAHVVLYETLKGAAVTLPWWLQEGLASLAEPDVREEYPGVLARAWQKQALVSMSDLCIPSFWNPDEVQLAYAEAASFVGFLQQRYGAQKLYRLLLAYATGLPCEEGVREVFGRSLSELEALWQQETLAYTGPELRQKIPVVLLWSGVLALVALSFTLVFVWIRRFA